MIVKKHNSSGRLVLGACDEALLNSKFEESGLVLDLTSAFYHGDTLTEDEFLDLVKKAYIVNAVGYKTVGCLMQANIIDSSETKEIKGVPYVQLVFEGRRI